MAAGICGVPAASRSPRRCRFPLQDGEPALLAHLSCQDVGQMLPSIFHSRSFYPADKTLKAPA